MNKDFLQCIKRKQQRVFNVLNDRFGYGFLWQDTWLPRPPMRQRGPHVILIGPRFPQASIIHDQMGHEYIPKYWGRI